MRFLSLLLIFSLVLCYSGICSATDLIADSTVVTSSHCDMANHDDADNSDESQVLIQDINTADSQNAHCCYEGLTNPSIDDNLINNNLVVVFLLDFPDFLETTNSNSIDFIFTQRVHGPPDIYLSVSRFLL